MEQAVRKPSKSSSTSSSSSSLPSSSRNNKKTGALEPGIMPRASSSRDSSTGQRGNKSAKKRPIESPRMTLKDALVTPPPFHPGSNSSSTSSLVIPPPKKRGKTSSSSKDLSVFSSFYEEQRGRSGGVVLSLDDSPLPVSQSRPRALDLSSPSTLVGNVNNRTRTATDVGLITLDSDDEREERLGKRLRTGQGHSTLPGSSNNHLQHYNGGFGQVLDTIPRINALPPIHFLASHKWRSMSGSKRAKLVLKHHEAVMVHLRPRQVALRLWWFVALSVCRELRGISRTIANGSASVNDGTGGGSVEGRGRGTGQASGKRVMTKRVVERQGILLGDMEITEAVKADALNARTRLVNPMGKMKAPNIGPLAVPPGKPFDKYQFRSSAIQAWALHLRKSWISRYTNPNTYLYRLTDVDVAQRMGDWDAKEVDSFYKRVKEFQELGIRMGNYWGLFSLAVPHRVGYQCANFYRQEVIRGNLPAGANWVWVEKTVPGPNGPVVKRGLEMSSNKVPDAEGAGDALMKRALPAIIAQWSRPSVVAAAAEIDDRFHHFFPQEEHGSTFQAALESNKLFAHVRGALVIRSTTVRISVPGPVSEAPARGVPAYNPTSGRSTSGAADAAAAAAAIAAARVAAPAVRDVVAGQPGPPGRAKGTPRPPSRPTAGSSAVVDGGSNAFSKAPPSAKSIADHRIVHLMTGVSAPAGTRPRVFNRKRARLASIADNLLSKAAAKYGNGSGGGGGDKSGSATTGGSAQRTEAGQNLSQRSRKAQAPQRATVTLPADITAELEQLGTAARGAPVETILVDLDTPAAIVPTGGQVPGSIDDTPVPIGPGHHDVVNIDSDHDGRDDDEGPAAIDFWSLFSYHEVHLHWDKSVKVGSLYQVLNLPPTPHPSTRVMLYRSTQGLSFEVGTESGDEVLDQVMSRFSTASSVASGYELRLGTNHPTTVRAFKEVFFALEAVAAHVDACPDPSRTRKILLPALSRAIVACGDLDPIRVLVTPDLGRRLQLRGSAHFGLAGRAVSWAGRLAERAGPAVDDQEVRLVKAFAPDGGFPERVMSGLLDKAPKHEGIGRLPMIRPVMAGQVFERPMMALLIDLVLAMGLEDGGAWAVFQRVMEGKWRDTGLPDRWEVGMVAEKKLQYLRTLEQLWEQLFVMTEAHLLAVPGSTSVIGHWEGLHWILAKSPLNPELTSAFVRGTTGRKQASLEELLYGSPQVRVNEMNVSLLGRMEELSRVWSGGNLHGVVQLWAMFPASGWLAVPETRQPELLPESLATASSGLEIWLRLLGTHLGRGDENGVRRAGGELLGVFRKIRRGSLVANDGKLVTAALSSVAVVTIAMEPVQLVTMLKQVVGPWKITAAPLEVMKAAGAGFAAWSRALEAVDRDAGPVVTEMSRLVVSLSQRWRKARGAASAAPMVGITATARGGTPSQSPKDARNEVFAIEGTLLDILDELEGLFLSRGSRLTPEPYLACVKDVFESLVVRNADVSPKIRTKALRVIRASLKGHLVSQYGLSEDEALVLVTDMAAGKAKRDPWLRWLAHDAKQGLTDLVLGSSIGSELRHLLVEVIAGIVAILVADPGHPLTLRRLASEYGQGSAWWKFLATPLWSLSVRFFTCFLAAWPDPLEDVEFGRDLLGVWLPGALAPRWNAGFARFTLSLAQVPSTARFFPLDQLSRLESLSEASDHSGVGGPRAGWVDEGAGGGEAVSGTDRSAVLGLVLRAVRGVWDEDGGPASGLATVMKSWHSYGWGAVTARDEDRPAVYETLGMVLRHLAPAIARGGVLVAVLCPWTRVLKGAIGPGVQASLTRAILGLTEVVGEGEGQMSGPKVFSELATFLQNTGGPKEVAVAFGRALALSKAAAADQKQRVRVFRSMLLAGVIVPWLRGRTGDVVSVHRLQVALEVFHCVWGVRGRSENRRPVLAVLPELLIGAGHPSLSVAVPCLQALQRLLGTHGSIDWLVANEDRGGLIVRLVSLCAVRAVFRGIVSTNASSDLRAEPRELAARVGVTDEDLELTELQDLVVRVLGPEKDLLGGGLGNFRGEVSGNVGKPLHGSRTLEDLGVAGIALLKVMSGDESRLVRAFVCECAWIVRDIVRSRFNCTHPKWAEKGFRELRDGVRSSLDVMPRSGSAKTVLL